MKSLGLPATFHKVKSYALAVGQKGFIHPASDSYEGESPPTDAIERTVDRLPERFQQLFDDIALLEYDGRLDDVAVSDFDTVAFRAADTHRSDVFLTHQEAENTAIQLGFEIGSIIKLLFGNNWKDIHRGILLAFIGEERQHVSRESDKLRELPRERHEQIPRQTLAHMAESHEEQFLATHGINDAAIKPPVQDAGLSPSEPLLHAIGAATPANRTEQDIQDELDDLLATTDVEELDYLYKHVCDDAETILSEQTDKHINGIDLRETLHAVANPATANKPSRIAGDATGSAVRDNLVTAVLKLLTTASDVPTPVTNDVVTNSHGDWKLTGYGKLVYYKAFDSDSERSTALEDDVEKLYCYAVNPGVLSTAEEELIADVMDKYTT